MLKRLRGQNSLFDYEKNQNTDNDNGEGFENPMCVAVDPVSNRVAVSDTGNSRIVVYDAYNSGVTPVAIIGRREGDAHFISSEHSKMSPSTATSSLPRPVKPKKTPTPTES